MSKTISEAGKAAAGAAAPAAAKTSAPASAAASSAAAAASAYTAPASAAANSAVAIAAPAALGTAGADAGVLFGQLAQVVAPFLGLGALAGVFVAASTGPAGGDSERDYEAHVTAGLAAQGWLSKQADDADEPIEGAVPAVDGPAKPVPNPWGKLGGPAHRAGVAAAEERMKAKYADDPEALVGTEVRVDTPDGEKKTRYLDVGVTRGEQDELIEGVQVGRITATGLIPSRERKAISDVLGAKPEAIIDYDAYIDLGK